MAKRRRLPGEQLKIAGTERRDRIPELDRLADEYRDIYDQWTGLKEVKGELEEQLIAELQARGLERYVYEDRAGYLQEITIADLQVKVTIKKLMKPRRKDDAEGAAN